MISAFRKVFNGQITGYSCAKNSSLSFLSPIVIYTAFTTFSVLLIWFPSDLYQRYVNESYFISSNFTYVLFFLAAWTAFILGAMIGKWYFQPKNDYYIVAEGTWSSYIIGSVALLGNGLLLLTLLAHIGAGKFVDGLLLSGYTKQHFNEIMAKLPLSWVFPMSVVSLTLLWWKMLASTSFFGIRRTLCHSILFWMLLVLFLMTNIISHQRGILVWLILSLFVVLMLRVSVDRRMTMIKVGSSLLCVLAIVVIIFFVFQYFRLRGTTNQPLHRAGSVFIGYFLGGFNRFADMLNGNYMLPYAGEGYYSGQMLWNMPVFGEVFRQLAHNIGMVFPVNQTKLFHDTFKTVRQAGLDDRYIWTTIYGWPFADFGWFSLPMFIGFGTLAQCAWERFELTNAASVMVYAYIFYSFMYWPASWMMLVNSVLFVAFSVFLILLERVIRLKFINAQCIHG